MLAKTGLFFLKFSLKQPEMLNVYIEKQIFITLSRVDIWKRNLVPSVFCGRGKRCDNSNLDEKLLILDESSKY